MWQIIYLHLMLDLPKFLHWFICIYFMIFFTVIVTIKFASYVKFVSRTEISPFVPISKLYTWASHFHSSSNPLNFQIFFREKLGELKRYKGTLWGNRQLEPIKFSCQQPSTGFILVHLGASITSSLPLFIFFFFVFIHTLTGS